MTWDELFRFMCERKPGYAQTIRGVALDDIILCEKNLRITLPTLYVEFLVTMGADCGAFRPFGATQISDFYELVEQLPPEDYPGARYFKVAFEGDESQITPYDIFLALQRSDGHDAPLVTFEDGGGFSEDYVVCKTLSLGETLMAQAFRQFELRQRRESATVYLRQHTPHPDTMRRIQEILMASGLIPTLSPQANVICLGRDDMSAVVALSGTGEAVGVEFGADEGKALSLLLERVLGVFPDATVSYPKRTRK